VPSAMLLGMLLTYGIQPGPAIVTEHLDLMYLIVWAFAIASVAGAFLCFLATGTLARLTRVPFAVLGPGLLVIMLLGAFQEGGQIGDLWVMVLLGVIGFFLKATGTPRAPFLIGFVLAIPMERYYYLTANLYDGASWMLRPGVLVFAAVLVVPVLWSLLKKLRGTSGQADDGHRDEHDGPEADLDDLEGSLAGTAWSAALAVLTVLVFAGALWVSGSFSEEARLMPRLVATCGLVASLLLVWQEVRVRRSRPERTLVEAPDEPHGSGGSTMVATRVEPVVDQHALARAHDIRIAARTFAAMAVFLGLAMVGGYLAATLVFTPAFLLYAARVRPRTAIAYTLVLGAVLLTLPSLLPVDLPMGLLQ
jgi:putative tricarboxylic transport membrane protein